MDLYLFVWPGIVLVRIVSAMAAAAEVVATNVFRLSIAGLTMSTSTKRADLIWPIKQKYGPEDFALTDDSHPQCCLGVNGVSRFSGFRRCVVRTSGNLKRLTGVPRRSGWMILLLRRARSRKSACCRANGIDLREPRRSRTETQIRSRRVGISVQPLPVWQ